MSLCKPTGCHALVNQPGILTSADMASMVDPTCKDKVVELAASALLPGQDAAPGSVEQLELDGSAGLLLDDDGATEPYRRSRGR